MRNDLTWKEGTGLPTEALLNSRMRVQQLSRDWLLPLWQRLAAVPVDRWRRALLILCAIWIVANLARLAWLLLPLHDAKPAAGAAPVNAAAAQGRHAARPAVDIEAMVGWHLFGEVGADPHAGAGAQIEEQAQNTSLNLQLLGAVNASDPKLARAVILADGRQQTFAIGDQVPGSGKVVLSKVLDDRVILDNNGRYETLWLYDPNATPLPRATTAAVSPLSRLPIRNGNGPDALASVREQLLQNAANTPKQPSLSDVIQVAPVSEGGKLIGYRVRPGRDHKRFEQFGFQADDVVTGINGVTLDDPQRALELYNTMRTAKEATFAVRRGGSEVKLSVSLENNNGGTE